MALTATPGYSANKHLNQHFHLAHCTTIHEAINAELISGYRNVLVHGKVVNLDEIPLSRGDFSQKALEWVVNITTRNMAAVDFYRHWVDPENGRPLLGQSAIINCVGIEHARAVAQLFCETIPASALGGRKPCAAVHGYMSKRKLDEVFEAHRKGEIACLAQAKLVGEGYDDKNIKLVLNLKPSLSLIEVPQRGGRALRFDPDNKEESALIVDFIDEGTLSEKLPLLFGEVAGKAAYSKPKASMMKRRKFRDVFSDDEDRCFKEVRRSDVRNCFHLPDVKVVWSYEEVSEVLRQRFAIRDTQNLKAHKQIYPEADPETFPWRAAQPPLEKPGKTRPLKNEDWLSINEVAERLDENYLTILRIFRRLRGKKDGSGYKYDPNNHYSWRIGKRYGPDFCCQCLHVSELSSFRSKYHLNVPIKTEEWLVPSEVVQKHNITAGRKILDTFVTRNIFRRLEKMPGHDGLLLDPITQASWRFSERRYGRGIVLCLHADEFINFSKYYRLDSPALQEGWLFPTQLMKQLRSIYFPTRQRVLERLFSFEQRSQNGKRKIKPIKYFCVCGRPQPCLNISWFDSFSVYYKEEDDRRAEKKRLAQEARLLARQVRDSCAGS